MKRAERQAIVEDLPFESKLAFMAFGAERCLAEARRHPEASRQLAALPELPRALERVWARAEGGSALDDAEIERLLELATSFEREDPERDRVDYTHDVTLVMAARGLRKTLELLRNPDIGASYVADAVSPPYQAVSVVYDDYKHARTGEVGVIENALLRLREAGNRPFSRALFADLPDWPRIALSERYAAGKIRGSDDDDD